MDNFRSEMMKTFDMSDLGLISYFSGLEIRQDSLRIYISQRKYVEDLLKSFNMINCKATVTPLSNSKLELHDDVEPTDITTSMNLIGKLIYLIQSRHDIAFLVSFMSIFMHQPTRNHYGAAKHILRYLAGTMDFGIFYRSGNGF